MKIDLGPYPENNKPRKILIDIERWDTWDVCYTLAQIAHPMLVQFQATKHGSAWIEDEDVPEELRSTSAPPKEHEWSTDDNFHARWDWVVGEMIFAMAWILADDEAYLSQEHQDSEPRCNNGLLLFGKYFRGLWD